MNVNRTLHTRHTRVHFSGGSRISHTRVEAATSEFVANTYMCVGGGMYAGVCMLEGSGGFRGRLRRAPPPTAQNFLDFMQFFGKFDKIVCWRPPRGSAPPPTGNPGSAPGGVYVKGACMQERCPLKWAVRILLECTLFGMILLKTAWKWKNWTGS